ncbi:MAG: hypothetical protein AAB074_05390 [Planctomycetota bacterium]
MKSSCLLVLALASLPAAADHAAGSTSSDGGQMTMSPDTLASGKLFVALRLDAADFEHVSDEELHEAGEAGHSRHGLDWAGTAALEGGFGILDRLMVGVTIPVRRTDDFREAPHHEEEVEEGEGSIRSVDPDGLGDVQIWAQLKILDGSFKLGVRLGLELPTGDTNDRGPHGDYLEPSHQAGSGSLDFLGGIAAGYSLESVGIQAALTGKVNTRGVRDFEMGDTVMLSVGGSWRFYGEPRTFSLSVTADAWGQWYGRNRHHGRGDPDSGGFQWYAAPGLRLNAGPFFAQLAVPIQIYNGVNEEPDQRLRGVLTAGLNF